MKILNNSDNFPSMSNEQLIEELCRLHESYMLAEKLGTGTGGVESIISSVKQELKSRGIHSRQQDRENNLEEAELQKRGDFAKNAVVAYENGKFNTEQLVAYPPEDDSDYWLISIDDIDQAGGKIPLIGGVAWVVDPLGKVFATSGSFPPARRIEMAREYFLEDDELIAQARQLQEDGHLIKTGPLAEKQADAPAATGLHYASNTEESARAKAEELLRNINPQYQGSYSLDQVADVGYRVWQDMRGGDSIIVGNDGGILFFNSSISAADGIQAYKDDKRTPEEYFTSAQ